ncbi:MAG: carboxypeptidase regulatory-like domain-containing protein [bacterium]|nr:carboxypeptidase regulatory-like domain-containing protein [bacterium]
MAFRSHLQSGWPLRPPSQARCGTVRDAPTLAPVERAGVFLRLPDWSYTGLHAASDAAGSWCIDNVPAGTYHLDVRVDDYRIGLVRDVVVTGSASGIDIAAQLPTTAIDAPWPNPAHGQVSFRLRLGAPGAATLAVYDVAGRACAPGPTPTRLPASAVRLTSATRRASRCPRAATTCAWRPVAPW